MEFKRGSKVKVMNKTELATPWCVAKVVPRNMHACNLTYDRCVDVSKVPNVTLSKHELQIPMPKENMCCEENNLLIYDIDANLPESRVVSSKKRASPFFLDAASNKKLKDDEQRISYSCSIGSCSNSPYETVSVAESSNASKDVNDDEDGGGIHELELHAYCFTLDALYASGPLTWDKEAMLTDLRINLHISNDEHLIHIRNLISTH